MPIRPSSVRITGSWNAMPKAKISDIISDRYSPTLGNSAICASLAAHLLHTEARSDQHRQHDEIDQHRPQHEEDGGSRSDKAKRRCARACRGQVRRTCRFASHDRKRDEASAKHRQLQLVMKYSSSARVDEFRIFGARDPDERPDQHVVICFAKEEADVKAIPKPSSALISRERSSIK